MHLLHIGHQFFLKKKLVTDMEKVHISKDETVLSEEIFKRLDHLSLIDNYEAYQILDDEWDKIAIDLEIIQTEGFEAAKKVDPNWVIKKKDGRDQEIQNGWVGHVLPFELVQQAYLKDEYQNLKQNESRLIEISAEFEEVLDSIPEEDKETEAFNEDRDAFAAAGVAKEAKQIRGGLKKGEILAEDSYEAKILRVDSLITEEKELKKEVKAKEAALHLKTKETIEQLSDKQVNELLELKWIHPLVTSLHRLPEEVITSLATQVQALADKYASTYKEVVEQIRKTEQSLSTLIDDLTANDSDQKGLAEFQLLLKGE
jgi:type I restriction enzyme M protein